MMMNGGVSSLHNHTHFSLQDGYSTPEEYLEKARKIGLKAFAVTEHGNQYSWCYFDKLKKEYPEIKIIYGVEMYECFDRQVEDKDSKYFHLVVLAKNENGRKALNHLVTLSNLHGFYYKPRIQLSDFEPYGKDLVVLSACLASKLARENDFETCIKYVEEYKKVFPYFYLEMQSHSHEAQAEYNKKILELSKITKTPFVITTDSHAAEKSDLYYQARHVQVAHDTETMSEAYEDCYLQSEEEIYEIMEKQISKENVRKGLEATNEVSDLIEEVSMPFQPPKLPTFPLPAGFKDNFEYLNYLTKEGWEKRQIPTLELEERSVYRKRLNYELKIIHEMGFDGYFLIVWDFINWARNNDVEVGVGRGSCAGSLVCYLLGITDINPIKYGLIFERFLNPERISMPDTDTDVSDREKVINYLIGKYGEDKVCQVINFSYITPVVAVKDVGKVLGFGYKEMDKLSQSFTYPTFEECLENNKTLVEKKVSENPLYEELFDIAKHLSGRIKTVSVHAGGVGIVDSNIDDYMGMKLGKDNAHVIQVDKRIIEEIGIIKFDILGVKTLGLLTEVKKDLNMDDWEININNPAFEKSKEPYKLLKTGRTDGVFQVESAGMKDLLVRLEPETLGDLSAILALYRPDSMGALNEYILNKHYPRKMTYFHPDLKPILKNTYACLIYQEQLLDIVRTFGGRSYGGADLFRKAIGKKNVQLVKQESAKLYQEIIDNNYPEEVAKKISDDLSEKGGYLFNKSHSYSYAVLCFQTAYLKAKYPVYFFKALLNINISTIGMVNKYIIDARKFGVEVVPPNINEAQVNFSVNSEKIMFGLSAVSGIGESLAKSIVEERNANGNFESLEDLTTRVKLPPAKVIMLIKSGAIPTRNRKKCIIRFLKSEFPLKEFVYKPLKTLPTKNELLEKWNIDTSSYMIGKKVDKEKVLEVFNERKKEYDREAFLVKRAEKFREYREKNTEKYLSNEDYWDFEALQIFLSNDPFEKAYTYLRQFDTVKQGEECVVVGIIAKVQKKKDKNKKQFAFINLYSSAGLIEGIVWHSLLKQSEDIVKKGTRVTVRCVKESEEKITCKDIRLYDGWLEEKEEERKKHKRLYAMPHIE